MKLVEILARELKEWPDGINELTQSCVGCEVYIDDEAGTSLTPPVFLSGRHDEDETYPVVTRAKWEAERARIAGINEQYTFHPGEAIMPSPFDLPRCEQELWDKVALKTLAAQIQNPQSIGADVGWCADVADAFMAERAKRMKG